MSIPISQPRPHGGTIHRLENLNWRPGVGPHDLPYVEASLESWFGDDCVTVRRYPDRYTFAYRGYSGVDDWTGDGDGDGQILHDILVILARIPRADYEADPDRFLPMLREKVDRAWREWGWPE